jgi:hypothetical protein
MRDRQRPAAGPNSPRPATKRLKIKAFLTFRAAI